MLVSITGTGSGSGGWAGGPTSNEISMALQQSASIVARGSAGSATQMLLADIAKYFSSIRVLNTTEVDGDWQADAVVNVQSRGNAPVSLKIQFQLLQQDAHWVIRAARLLQS
jgi:hypothetical protein